MNFPEIASFSGAVVKKTRFWVPLLFVLTSLVLSIFVRHPASTIFALVPPVTAILLAWAWRRVLTGLLLGVFSGALVLERLNPFTATLETAWDLLVKTAVEPDSLEIFAFTLLLAGMVGIMIRSGAVADLVDRMSGIARGRRSGQALVETLGILVFFDDYANTMVVGAASRPLTDRLGISREKLAYLVDSTAAPVASLALVSTWIGIEISYLTKQMPVLHQFAGSGYGVFLQLIPFRLYCLFTLVMLTIIAATGRDFGPMLAAERLARPMSVGAGQGGHARKGHWAGAVFPVVTVLVAIMLAFLIEGGQRLGRPIDLFSIGFWRDAFVAVDNSSMLLVLASFAGIIIAACFALCGRVLTVKKTVIAALASMRTMLPALALLVLAQALRKVTDTQHLQAAQYLVSLLSNLNLHFVPLSIFLVAAAVAFATGTSWGTMGILIPVAVPLSAAAVQHAHGNPVIILISTAAVLDGAVFGDHCSPISDTTVMSSIGSSCDHLSHVRTQMPYAVTTMLVAAIVGYLGLPLLGLPVWAVYITGTAILAGIVFFVGKKA